MAESKQIEERLNAVGIPIAYRQFKPFKGKPVPPPPYLVYYAERESVRGADGKDLYKQLHIVVELYTDKKRRRLKTASRAQSMNLNLTSTKITSTKNGCGAYLGNSTSIKKYGGFENVKEIGNRNPDTWER